LFRPYKTTIDQDGSYNFISDQNHTYLVYFSEYKLSDAEGNEHTTYNLGFLKNGDFKNKSFKDKYDNRVSDTIIAIVNEFFLKNSHRALIYFCFGDDGYARHRNIVFNQWSKNLHLSLEKHNNSIPFESTILYSSLILVKNNPLKKLIITAFDKYLDEMSNKI